MKILVVNLHSSANAGDDLLTEVTVKQLQESFQNPKIVLSMNDPASYSDDNVTVVGSFMSWCRKSGDDLSWIHLLFFIGVLLESLFFAGLYRLIGVSVLKIVPLRHKSLLAGYFSADLVVSAAGNFLYTSGRLGLAFMMAIYTMAYAWLVGKPLYTMPQTIGPLRRGWERNLVKWIAGKSQILFVRDVVSLAELKKAGVSPERHRLVPDLAFAYPRCSPDLGYKLLAEHNVFRQEGMPLLGITMMNWEAQMPLFTNQAVYETAVVKAIQTFVGEYNGKVVLFSQVRGPTYAEDDRVPACRVWKQIRHLGTAVVMIEREVTTEELKSAYGYMDIFIGTRLHSNIFAICEYVPAVMIEYRHKTRGVMQMLGLDAWVIDIHAIKSDDVSTKMQELWCERELVRQHIQAVLPDVVRQASQVGRYIADDYNQMNK